jgi:hypothetical protein
MLSSDFLAWKLASEELEIAKEKELSKRMALLKNHLTESNSSVVNSITMPNGEVFKLIYNYSYRLTSGLYDCLSTIDDIKKKYPVESDTVEGLVKMRPSFSKSKYNKLSDGAKDMVGKIVEITRGLPRLLSYSGVK